MVSENENIQQEEKLKKKRKIFKFSTKTKVICFVIFSLLLLATGWYLGNPAFKSKSVTVVNNPLLITKSIVENFEISALEYNYRDLIFEENKENRSFWFIPLDPAVKRYAVQFDGRMKMGINGKDIKIDEGNGVIKITIPKAQLISHEMPVDDVIEVVFDEGDNAKNFTITEYLVRFNERKKIIETKVAQSDMYKQAQESTKKQLEVMFNALLNENSTYHFEFILEE